MQGHVLTLIMLSGGCLMKNNIIPLRGGDVRPVVSVDDLQAENTRLAAENRYLLGRLQHYQEYCRRLEYKLHCD